MEVDYLKKLRTRKDLEADARVEELDHEAENGWYVFLKPGFAFDGERRGNLERTIREMCQAMRTVVEVPLVDRENDYSRTR